ncbi:hypothetical protein, partial [Lysinibacillus sphaericus]|uniref:hypothetical protein n=3 Tax=Lysinibacillus sphaericus TaxID=1421 RepID=UPI00056203AF
PCESRTSLGTQSSQHIAGCFFYFEQLRESIIFIGSRYFFKMENHNSLSSILNFNKVSIEELESVDAGNILFLQFQSPLRAF